MKLGGGGGEAGSGRRTNWRTPSGSDLAFARATVLACVRLIVGAPMGSLKRRRERERESTSKSKVELGQLWRTLAAIIINIYLPKVDNFMSLRPIKMAFISILSLNSDREQSGLLGN